MSRLLKKLRPDERGATAVEYGLIAALIVLAMIGALGGVADVTVNMWNNVSSNVQKNT
jgi:pilus assembly protein Flp/PilA